jgi:hypothetical protein
MIRHSDDSGCGPFPRHSLKGPRRPPRTPAVALTFLGRRTSRRSSVVGGADESVWSAAGSATRMEWTYDDEGGSNTERTTECIVLSSELRSW